MRAFRLVPAALAALLAGCIQADLPQLTTAGRAVATGKSDPAPGTQEMAPSKVAPVLAHLDAGAQLTVSNQVRDGWRTTALRDGRVAYVQDAVLRIAGPAPRSGS